MSDDLVKRLRGFPPNIYETMTEAADRIAELEAALKNSADALREAGCNFAWAVANAALEGGKDG